MGLHTIATAAGQLTRSASEQSLFQNQERRRINVNNTISTARAQELDARTQESDDSQKSTLEKYYQLKSAEAAETAATLGFVSSLVGAIGNLGSAIAKGDIGGAIVGAVGSVFSVLGAYMTMIGAGDEVEMLEQQIGVLSEGAKEDMEMVQALDSNPELS